jgi:hypothetical protein
MMVCLADTKHRNANQVKMDNKKILIITLLVLTLPCSVFADFVFRRGSNLGVNLQANEAEVVRTAMAMFGRDYHAVFNGKIVTLGKIQLYIGTLGNGTVAEKMLDQKSINNLKAHVEGYILQVKNNQLIVVGSDKRGTAYGILELSRRIGVSPWEWWADSQIEQQHALTLKNGFVLAYPSVKMRGIFINDEDFGLNPWSAKTYEPAKISGQIGPKTHARIFELLLRLRANTFWAAMHEVSVAFYQIRGNKEMAAKYGIIMGASHCEPMMRNSNGEWKIDGKGEYDYVNNREQVLQFWQSRVNELKHSENVYTLGIRGVHDGKMQGANTLQEQKDAITNIFKDQRNMLASTLNSELEKVPQVFIPYKEVLDVYHMGLEVPDDVTLMWTDDNYGYIRHFPTAQERARKGGNGMYYHISYWGRPHDYLWLATTHPAQIYTQMKMAYQKGAKDLWILNVGDIKPGEYLTELFLDLAWNINAISDHKAGLNQHLQNWLAREFGAKNAVTLRTMMEEYYRLAYIRKPELMGNTRTEEKEPKFKEIADLPFTVKEIRARLADYQRISNQVLAMSKTISVAKKDAWFQLIEYPVLAAAAMNNKILYGQLAKYDLAQWAQSDAAFDQIQKLTSRYNQLAGGKWKNMMNAKPRNLAVFMPVPKTKAVSFWPNVPTPIVVFNGTAYHQFEGNRPVTHGLGYESAAIELRKNSTVHYAFEAVDTDSIYIAVALAPNHPVDGKFIRYEISMDGGPTQIVEYHTTDRSEEWKINVLTNQAIRISKLKLNRLSKLHQIKIKALDEGVILDQLTIYAQQQPLKLR